MSDRLNLLVKPWYQVQFPTDDLGDYINEKLTFNSVMSALKKRQEIYDVLGVGDSIVRERVFSKLAEIAGVTYSQIYELWLESAA